MKKDNRISKFLDDSSNNSDNNIITTVISIIGFILCSDLSLMLSLINIKLYYVLFFIICILSMLILLTNINREICLKKLLWMPLFIVIIYSNMLHNNEKLAFLQLTSIIIFIIFVGDIHLNNLNQLKKIVFLFGLFHVFGVLLQLAFPHIYGNIYQIIDGFQQNRILTNQEAYRMQASGYFTGFTYNPGLTAMYIINGFTMLLMSKGYFRKLHFNIIVAVFFFSLILTGKRTMCIAAIIAYIICYALDHGMNFRRIVLIFVPMLICFVLLYYMFMFVYSFSFVQEKLPSIYRILSAIYDKSGGESVTIRHNMWDQAMELYKNNKVFGAGWNTFVRKYGNVPHNTYIQVLSELGIIGFISFIIPLASSFLIVFKKYITYRSFEDRDRTIDNHYLAIIFFEIIYIIYSYTGNTLWDCEVYFMYFLLVSISFYLPVSVEEGSDTLEDTSHI